MNRTIRSMFVVIAAVLAFTAVQAVWAADCSVTVEGTVTSVDYTVDENGILLDNTIVVGTTTVKGINLLYLAEHEKIVLVEGVSQVVITGVLCQNLQEVRACTISVDGGAVIDLLPGKYLP